MNAPSSTNPAGVLGMYCRQRVRSNSDRAPLAAGDGDVEAISRQQERHSSRNVLDGEAAIDDCRSGLAALELVDGTDLDLRGTGLGEIALDGADLGVVRRDHEDVRLLEGRVPLELARVGPWRTEALDLANDLLGLFPGTMELPR